MKSVVWLITLSILWCTFSYAQESNKREYYLTELSDTITLDSLSIYPSSLQVFCGESQLADSDYYFDFNSTQFFLRKACQDSIRLEYRVFSLNFSKIYAEKDTSLIYAGQNKTIDDFKYTASFDAEDIFGGSGIQKSGSISRGVSFGNNQDLSVNSSLNLQLAGNISPNLKILASVSDANIPIQPDGNTNQLQEFDQIFIQLYNDKFKLIAGDFWLKKPKGHFLNYNKRAQGLFLQNTWQNENGGSWTVQGAGALSKGKFARNIIQGAEGNQGPYRLRGNENEPFIIVLAGTELVYLDGKLLDRGQEFDYTVDYNTSEVTFTARHLITKDSRIVIEFQYSDQNYARSLFQARTNYQTDKLDFWFNAYTEQDVKSQSLQQELSLSDKKLLAESGDSLNLARVTAIDSIGYFDNQVLYKLIDSLGIDSVLVYSVNPDSAFFRARFTQVGLGQGDYVFDRYTAVGKVYKWVNPVGGVSQGNYTPAAILASPKRKQLISTGISYKINKTFTVEGEISTSKNDINTFARKDKSDDDAIGLRGKLTGEFDLGRDSFPKWSLKTDVELEYIGEYFSPIERYRNVEFDRNWNIRGQNYLGNQFIGKSDFTFQRKNAGTIGLGYENFTIGKDFQGDRANLNVNWNKRGWKININDSYLKAQSGEDNSYLRHKTTLSKDLKYFKIGYTDDLERNEFRSNGILESNSYQWYDWQVFIGQADSAKNGYRVFYRERYDNKSDSIQLRSAAKATSVGASYNWVTNKYSKLNAMISYRSLQITDSNLIEATPENTTLGRIDYSLKAIKSALTTNTFYEVGSGLELKKEFLYLEVNAGQGVYTWIDYNGDGVKDLNEFEIAQFTDQANYIRVFVPSNEYVKTFSNEFNQSIFWRPERIWARKKGALKLLSRFSDQARFRIARKTSESVSGSYNPFDTRIGDTSLISTSSTIRNTLFFNRTNSIFGLDHSYQKVQSKVLLANGFDARISEYHQINLRWNIKKKITFKNKVEIGNKTALVDYTENRNYDIKYTSIEPSFIYQPNTKFRVSLDLRRIDKQNNPDFGGETAGINDLGINFKFNQANSGSLQGGFNTIIIKYEGAQNNSLSFEMLESLKPGNNFTWNLGYQKSISKNMQVSLQYTGRKSEENKAIHSGSLEVRAFF